MYLGSLTTWLRLLQQHGFDWQYTPRVLGITAVSTLTAPLRLLERRLYGKAIDATPITHPPIFIIGYPRSGTTHLHNLLSQDPQFGYVTQFQALAPDAFLLGQKWLRPLAHKLLPAKRPQDNVRLFLDAPQEEEIALAHTSIHSEFHGLFFPRQMRQFVTKYTLFEGVTASEKIAWEQAYLRVLKKATRHMDGKQLLLKTPANVARISTLLTLFPQAKFIHIYRNPYLVYTSAVHTLHSVTEMLGCQKIDRQTLEDNVLFFYRAMMQKFLDDSPHIPAGNLVSVRFETLEQTPMALLKTIYQSLNLPGLTEAQPHFERYLAGQRHYQKNQYQLDETTIRTIQAHWQFTIDRWHYHPPAADPIIRS
jgi:omega-hydroxy-beta-dihydromenaquinone-9 sulfotransferase